MRLKSYLDFGISGILLALRPRPVSCYTIQYEVRGSGSRESRCLDIT
jgi:hypothetical protein